MALGRLPPRWGFGVALDIDSQGFRPGLLTITPLGLRTLRAVVVHCSSRLERETFPRWPRIVVEFFGPILTMAFIRRAE